MDTCVFVGDSLVSWSLKKQNVVSWSNAESEYCVLDNLAAKLVWVKSFDERVELSYSKTFCSVV